MNISRLLELHELAKSEGRRYPLKRSLYAEVSTRTGRHFTGIVGPRGAGKTILLKQLAVENEDAFYLSVDVLEGDADFLALIRKLTEQLKFRTILLDEIHFLHRPAATLEQLYDFLDIRVVFTSSVALAIHESAHDLSRRVRLLPLRYFSYREYLRFAAGMDLPPLSIASLIEGNWSPEHLRAAHRFGDYLTGGMMPLALQEPDPLPLLGSILEAVIGRDVPSVLRLAVDELDILKRLLRFVGRSPVDGINYSSLSRNLGITNYKAEQYVTCLEKAFVLHQVLPAGMNVLREPKVLMAPPSRLLYRDYDDSVGGLREDFVVEALLQAGIKLNYLKSTRGAKTPDFLVEHAGQSLVLEVGGRGKGRQQFKGFRADRKLVLAHADVPAEDRVPLFLLGFLESERRAAL